MFAAEAQIGSSERNQKRRWTMRSRALCLLVPVFLFLAAWGPALAGPSSGADVGAVVGGNNQFAFDIYKTLAGQEQGNLFLSPYSISTAMAMTYAGARGNTATQMADALGFTLPQDDLHEAFGELIDDINDPQRLDYQLSTANRLWGQQGYGFLPEYLNTTGQHYGAELAPVDFIGAAEPARLTINSWVADQTQQRIQNLLPAGSVTAQTRLVLTNAIYFKSDWKHQFDPEQTQLESFWTAPSKSVSVSMMHQTNDLKHAETTSFQILELPYANKEMSMLALLPNQRDGLAEMEAMLTADTLAQAIAQMQEKEVIVSMPKFGMTQDFELSSVLASLGMTDAFDPTAADLSGINGRSDLFISGVAHKAFINLDEEGTEAAAATGVVIGVTSVGPPPVRFDADHPFVFLIRDNRTGGIMFMGRVADLEAGAAGIVVPEPATMSMLILGGAVLLRRRRQ